MKKVLTAVWVILFFASPALAQTMGVGLIPGPPGPAGTGYTDAQAQAAAIAIMPQPATSAPPCIADGGTAGTGTIYALANHTHCSKVRKGVTNTANDGTVTVTFGTAFSAGVTPICLSTADPPAGTTDVINSQGDGDPTSTSAKFRITRAVPTLNGLLGLLIPVLASTPGVTKLHYACFEP